MDAINRLAGLPEFSGFKSIGCSIDFQRKDINENFTGHEYWCGDIYNVFSGWEYIEWLNIKALATQRRAASAVQISFPSNLSL